MANEGASWLDYSNDRVQAQTFGVALEAAGPLAGRSVLDVGCGWGQLASMAAAAGASNVTGIDVAAELVEACTIRHPLVRFVRASPTDARALASLGRFDVILAIEVLAYVSFPDALSNLWGQLTPGGRLVIVVPNADCPIVRRTQDRFDGYYRALSPAAVRAAAGGLHDVETVQLRGLTFAEDQRIAPYSVSPWSTEPCWSSPPNRLQVALLKAR